MNIFNAFRTDILAAVERLVTAGKLPVGLATAAIAVEPPRDPSHGDMATNAAMVLAKPAKLPPRQIAEALKDELARVAGIDGVEVAGPGFLNLRLNAMVWQAEVQRILATGPAYGDSTMGARRPVNVEYVSANPTGPMHVGHCRGAVFGDALAALLEKAGFAVTREYYINDAGAQVDVLARSAWWRYREALGESVTIPEGLYPGDYLKPVGQAAAQQFGDRYRGADEATFLPLFKPLAIDAMMTMIREDLSALGISFAVFTSERKLHEGGAIAGMVAELEQADLVYRGTLEPPKGQKPDDWEPREQLLFRATKFGDDTDRPLQKSDGTWTYFAADIAYHHDKFRRGFLAMINVLGADHGGYVKRLKAAVSAVSAGTAELDAKIVQLVNLLDGGVPVKMSKRAGTFVTLRDVVDEVGKDVVRFIMLTRKNDAPLDFDFQAVREQSKDNPVFYVQYAHARICSALRKAGEGMPGTALDDRALVLAKLDLLTAPAEQVLLRRVAAWPRAVEQAAEAHEPHRIAFFLHDLAAELHSYWATGNEDPALRVIRAEAPAETLARLALVRSVAIIIASGLKVMGVTPVEEMH
jgi:arginyl-tRNA synthetase